MLGSTSAMSGDGDALPAAIPKRARTAVKRPDPIETKNRMKGKMNNLNKRSPERRTQRQTSDKEKEVAEALFDLANLAGSPDLEDGGDLLGPDSHKRGRGKREDMDPRGKSAKNGKKADFANGGQGGFGVNMGAAGGKFGQEALKFGQGAAGLLGNPWPQGLPHPAFSQNLYSQMMAWQQASLPAGLGAAQPALQQQAAPAAPAKSLKRCANHVYIAHLIYYHQRMQQASLLQTMSMQSMGMNLATAGLPGVPQLDAQNLLLQQQQQQEPVVAAAAAAQPSPIAGPAVMGSGDAKAQSQGDAGQQAAAAAAALGGVGLQAQLAAGIKAEQDANGLKSQLTMPNPALLSLLGYPHLQQAAAGGKGAMDAMAALGQAGALNPMGNLQQQLMMQMAALGPQAATGALGQATSIPMQQMMQMASLQQGLMPQMMMQMAAQPATQLAAFAGAGDAVVPDPTNPLLGAGLAQFSAGMPALTPQLLQLQAQQGVRDPLLAGQLANQASLGNANNVKNLQALPVFNNNPTTTTTAAAATTTTNTATNAATTTTTNANVATTSAGGVLGQASAPIQPKKAEAT